MNADFANRMYHEVQKAQEDHDHVRSAYEGVALIEQQFDAFKRVVFRNPKHNDDEPLLQALSHVAAMCWRTALDLGLSE